MYSGGSMFTQLPNNIAEHLANLGSQTPSAAEKYVLATVSFHESACGVKRVSGYLTAEQAFPHAREVAGMIEAQAAKLDALPSFREARQRYEKRNGHVRYELMILDSTNMARGALYNIDGFRVDDRGRITQDRLDAKLDGSLNALTDEHKPGPIHHDLPESIASRLAAMGSMTPKGSEHYAIAHVWISNESSSVKQVSTCFSVTDATRRLAEAKNLLVVHAEDVARSRTSSRIRYESKYGQLDERLLLIDTATGQLYDERGIGLDFLGKPTALRLGAEFASASGYKL